MAWQARACLRKVEAGYAASLSASAMMALAAIHDPAIRMAIGLMRCGNARERSAVAATRASADIAVAARLVTVSAIESTGGTESNINVPETAATTAVAAGTGSATLAASNSPIAAPRQRTRISACV